ncbi:MAG: hypothetical protein K9J13_14700 [Saprospiraceae bacterium]|nr:hypothetical protein [Saprospiraceae bacterium]
MRNTIKIMLTIVTAVLLLFTLVKCKKDPEQVVPITEPTPTDTSLASCEGCHTNYAHLQEIYTPDTAAPAGGCGGEAPHYEPYDRVFMGGAGFDEYKKSGHYAVGCVGCHNGTEGTSDKLVAHSGNFISHPSAFYDEKCGSCHQVIVNKFKTSLHNGTGQKRKVAIRSGYTSSQDFDKLPAHQIEGYNANCATCHGTCGNCHVVRPPIGGGGLAQGHQFKKTPDMISICVTCHTSRGGHAYFGVASGTQPDVHLSKKGFSCHECHTGGELHGNGLPVEQRYAYVALPKCLSCHSSSSASNNYHTEHFTDFNCQVCHSQDYNNCGSCHIHGDGARVPAYLGFKIASNPLPTLKPGYDFTLVRRTLAAPDNWEKYGVPAYANFDALPTYNYTSPHNILKITSRTDVGTASCSSKCHIRNENGTLVNKELYLYSSDLLSWEQTASANIVVDGKLPAAWFVKK